MWACYTSTFWETAEDLQSAIRRIQSQFRALAFEACHSTNYDLTVCWDPEEVNHLNDLEARYEEGADVCQLYFDSEISLECLLYELLKLDFQRFIQDLREFLPADLKERFTTEEPVSSDQYSE